MNDSTDTPPSGEVPLGNPASPPKAPKQRFLARLRNYFLAGIVVTAPISITIYVAALFINFVDSKVTPLIPAAYNPETYLPFSLPGLGLLIVIIVMAIIGAVTAGFVGRAFIGWGEQILARMPVVRSIYSALKQIFESVLAEKSRAFRQVVLIEYPRKGCWALGFATGTTKGEVQHAIKDEVVNVFLPTTPNPTSGYLLFLPRSDVIFLSMTVEQGIKMVISGGVVTPSEVDAPVDVHGDVHGEAPVPRIATRRDDAAVVAGEIDQG